MIKAKVVGVVFDYHNGEIFQRAQSLKIPFIYFMEPNNTEEYQNIITKFQPDYIIYADWPKPIAESEEGRIINICHGPFPWINDKNLQGSKIYKEIIAAYKRGEIDQSAISMHFVNKLNRGSGIIQIPVLIRPEDTAKTLEERVTKTGYNYIILALNEIIMGRIFSSGNGGSFVKRKTLRRFAFCNR